MKSAAQALARLSLAGFATVLLLMASAWAGTPTETVIGTLSPAYSFPLYGLVADSSGNLYGTTTNGSLSPYGSVFQLAPGNGDWLYTTLMNFDGKNGNLPLSSMIFDSKGNLYGTTTQGGTGNCMSGTQVVGCGVVFELSPTSGGGWAYSVIYSFQGGSDGTGPAGNLLIDQAGNLFGTTGATGSGSAQNGTVWRLKPPAQQGGAWKEEVLLRFGGTNGFIPNSLMFKHGALYGTTAEGGSNNYAGTVFQLKPVNGVWTLTTLYAFSNGPDGGFPFSVIASATSGDLYGTTSQGGQFNWGTVFKLTPNANGTWTESVIYDFTGGADGATPESPLIHDKSDNLYGTTNSGGYTSECGFSYPFDGCGVVFKVVPSTGAETVLHAFSDTGTDGNVPFASGVILGKGGVLYGTTEFGGGTPCTDFNGATVGCGTVYQLNP